MGGRAKPTNSKQFLPFLDCPLPGLSSRSRQNLLDHRRLGIGIVLDVRPVPSHQLPLGALVELTIGGVAFVGFVVPG
jgi:hypothetical protein